MHDGTGSLCLPSGDSEQAHSGGGPGFPGALLAWLGGARASILRLCPGERSFYAALGMGVLLTAMFGGVSAAFAIGYALHESVRQLWPVAVFWALALVNIDRLLLMITASRSRLWAMVPRLLISALLGFLIAEPLTLRIFQPEIDTQIAITQQQAQSTQLAQIQRTYQPEINADNNQIAALNDKLTSAQNAVTRDQFLANCESGETDCSTTRRLGLGPYYYRYKQDAAVAEAHYTAIAPGIHSRIQALKDEISILNGEEVTAERNVHAAIAGGAGWAARETALDQLMAQNRGIDLTVWAVRLAFVLIDLAPLIVKFMVILFGRQIYDEIAAAERDWNRRQAHRLTELARLERNKITRRTVAEDEIDEAIVNADKEDRMTPARAHAQPTRGTPRMTRMPAPNPIRFAHASKIHERMAVATAHTLSRLAWIASGLLAAGTMMISAGAPRKTRGSGRTPAVAADSHKEPPIPKAASVARLGKIARTAGTVALAAVITLTAGSIYNWPLEREKAANAILQAKVTLWQSKANSLDSSNKALCSIMHSAAASGQFSPPGLAESICGDNMSPPVATTRPQAGDSVPMVTEASGTADIKQLNGRTIWFAVTTPGITGYFIQGNWQAKSGPATITADGKWTSPGIFVGRPNETGKPFDIVVILADNSAVNEFWTYLRRGHDTGSFPAIALPSGATEYLRVNVVRK